MVINNLHILVRVYCLGMSMISTTVTEWSGNELLCYKHKTKTAKQTKHNWVFQQDTDPVCGYSGFKMAKSSWNEAFDCTL